MVEIVIEEPIIGQSPGINPGRIRLAAEASLKLHQLSLDDHVLTVVITNDEKIALLNRQYRQVDAPTDVLSFTAHEKNPESGEIYLGDVVISYERARENLDERLGVWQTSDLESELLLLTIHGVLHLIGYDHAVPEEEAAMWMKQDTILRQLE